MLRLLFATILTVASAPLLAADVGLSISVGDPGFYGRIDIGNTVKPDVIYAEPVIIQQRPSPVVYVEPIYLRVPPGYERHWGHYCHEYDACDRPVYFIQDTWYERNYASREHEHHGHWHGHGHGHGHDYDD